MSGGWDRRRGTLRNFFEGVGELDQGHHMMVVMDMVVMVVNRRWSGRSGVEILSRAFYIF